ncbi:VOC family protein [Leisingera sp. NJS204]|uniref:VOC family protein n=1 Tax=Leisingera sp. NJS204 TaxID=2508307 RepID=UPI0010117ECB|nr:VOC family protein [Leisingera sp. NJS204]QAX30038.1 VOC family protein [Leisingera sp. NJS204]
MEQRVSLITLGVPDMESAAAFYEALGWQRAESPDGVIAFDLISQTLGLYPLAALAAEIGLSEAELGTGAVTLSHNTRSKEDVAVLLTAAEAAGAEVLKPAQDVFWGGHHGYFRSPDGHIWEIAFNPFSELAGNGAFCWNGY